jgi:membrane-associated phospholipid phosphatase
VALVNVKPTTLDLKLAHAIERHTSRKAERVAKILTWGADEKLLLAAVAFGWICSRRGSDPARRLGDQFLAATIAAAILPHVMKSLIDQERPDRRTVRGHWRGVPFSGKRYDAFPSGHSVHVGALASAATLLPASWRPVIWGIGGVLVSTRVVLLAHWLSDVVAGLAIGAVIERLLRPLTLPAPERQTGARTCSVEKGQPRDHSRVRRTWKIS